MSFAKIIQYYGIIILFCVFTRDPAPGLVWFPSMEISDQPKGLVIYGPLHGQILEGPVSASHNNPPLSVPQGPWGKPSFGRVPKEAKRPGMIAAPPHVLHRCELLFSFPISVRQEKSNQKRKVPPLQRRGFSSSLQADLLDPRKLFRGERNYVAGTLSAPL